MADAPAAQSIAWSDDFLIGIEELDYEHRHLIDDINTLHRQLLAAVDMNRIEDTLSSIHARMQAHFALEEHVMVSNKYPYYREHKAEHERLLDEYTEIMTGFKRDPDSADRGAVGAMLCHWIVDHILGNDKKMSLMMAGGMHE